MWIIYKTKQGLLLANRPNGPTFFRPVYMFHEFQLFQKILDGSFFIEFDKQTHCSIALLMFYQTSFGSDSIRWRIRPQIGGMISANCRIFGELVIKRFVRSSRTQKASCRVHSGLSADTCFIHFNSSPDSNYWNFLWKVFHFYPAGDSKRTLWTFGWSDDVYQVHGTTLWDR